MFTFYWVSDLWCNSLSVFAARDLSSYRMLPALLSEGTCTVRTLCRDDPPFAKTA
jgi:hypothetical protein